MDGQVVNSTEYSLFLWHYETTSDIIAASWIDVNFNYFIKLISFIHLFIIYTSND